jgi:hyperosmotically inducible protein
MTAQIFGALSAQSLNIQKSSTAFEQTAPATAEQKEVDRLLKQISANAAIASNQADALDSFTQWGPRLQFETHASALTTAKEAINSMGKDFRRLQELRPSALPWQQLVIDRMEPVLVGMAKHTTQAIEQLNQDRRKPPSQEHRDAIGNLNAYAGHARNLMAVNLNYAQARGKLNQLDASSLGPVAKASTTTKSAALPAKAPVSLEQRVRSELLKLPWYGVFDHLTYRVDNDQVTLSGQVHWPALKTDAERAVSRVEQVAGVTNTIEVLPLSPNDDRIRIEAYRAIYGNSTLARYRLNPHPPIRIIVKNGNLTLMGAVGSEMDRTIAHMQASAVPGAFSVTNNLQID